MHKVNFVAVGPQKTGTTWLYRQLKNNQNICFPKSVKETMFFDQYYSSGFKRYNSYFKHSQGLQICGEVAPTYFDCQEAAQRIYCHNPNCKIIITLRHPVYRAFSLYCHHLRKGRVPNSFMLAAEQMPRILSSGHYGMHISHWLSLFEQRNLLFLLMDDIEQQPQNVLQKVSRFLDISPPALLPDKTLKKKINQASLPKYRQAAKFGTLTANFLRKHQFDYLVECLKKLGLKKIYTGGEERMPQLTQDDVVRLKNLYREDIEFVEHLLERDLNIWKRVEI